jgi:hypothetical protein
MRSANSGDGSQVIVDLTSELSGTLSQSEMNYR